MPHELSRTEARRIALHAQLLTAARPADLEEVLAGVALVQVEPTRAVAPTAELVLWSRLGSSFDARDLWDAVDEQRVLEFRGALRLPDEVGLYRAEMDDWPGEEEHLRLAAGWVEDNDACRLDVLDRLRADGPLPASELPDTCVRPWRSSGWNNHRNLTMMLKMLVARGEVAAAGGTGRHRLWDLAERVYPDDPGHGLEEAARLRDARRLASLGISRPGHRSVPGEPVDVGEAGEAAVVEGVKGTWRVDPAYLGLPFEGRTALLSPFDRLLADRKRMAEVFEFDYLLEMYKPADKRRWGYYALPVLHADRLVGKLDAKADRDAGVLRVHAVHEDEPFTPAMTEAVDAEVEDLARWLDLRVVRDPA